MGGSTSASRECQARRGFVVRSSRVILLKNRREEGAEDEAAAAAAATACVEVGSGPVWVSPKASRSAADASQRASQQVGAASACTPPIRPSCTSAQADPALWLAAT